MVTEIKEMEKKLASQLLEGSIQDSFQFVLGSPMEMFGFPESKSVTLVMFAPNVHPN